MLVHGNIEDFNGRLNFKCDSIAYCVKVEQIQKEEPVVEIKKEPLDKYLCAPPEPYFEMAQDNLFASGDEIGQYLMDNDVVVFDIETTGLEVSRCEIIEIGAVKLHNGKKECKKIVNNIKKSQSNNITLLRELLYFQKTAY